MTKWINTRGTHDKYHTDEECQYLRNGTYREVHANEIDTHDLEQCKRCAGSSEVDGGKDSKFKSFRYVVDDLVNND